MPEMEVMMELPSGKLAVPRLGDGTGYFIAEEECQAYAEDELLFGACMQAGGTMGDGLATSAILALHNPAGSGVTGRLWYAHLELTIANVEIVGDAVWLGVNTNTNAAIVTGTAAVVRKYSLGGGVNNVQGQKLLALTAATLPAAPVALCTLGALLTGAITTLPQAVPFRRKFYGAMLIQPGTTVSFQIQDATDTASAFGELVWSEHTEIAVSED